MNKRESNLHGNKPLPPVWRWAGLLVVVVGLAAGFAVAQDSEEREPGAAWIELFNGRDLEGWVRRGGAARYEAQDGAIVGTSVPDTRNTFLCTAKDYADFILELQFKIDEGLNSGVQIRSMSRPDYLEGRVHGYQVEIDPSKRSWTGGIYDESRRGWLADLKANEPARRAFKHGEWNQLRIEARGPRMRTWLNGVGAADLVDTATLRGFIALQVHAVQTTQPLQVRWRAIRLQELGAASATPAAASQD